MQQVALCCGCGTVGGVSAQQVALCCECGTVGGVSVQQVALCCECGSWGSGCAAGGFVLCAMES